MRCITGATMSKPAAAGPKKMGELYRESAKKKDVRASNIEAAKAVADAVRTSLGPRGMDKMVRAACFAVSLRHGPHGCRISVAREPA